MEVQGILIYCLILYIAIHWQIYLSEETGYSHLYVKPLNGKAKQLTHGSYEVSDLTLTDDESRILFKANKKHPGIYEIYQVDMTSGDLTALTDLGGKNEYSLSPDESKLLILSQIKSSFSQFGYRNKS